MIFNTKSPECLFAFAFTPLLACSCTRAVVGVRERIEVVLRRVDAAKNFGDTRAVILSCVGVVVEHGVVRAATNHCGRASGHFCDRVVWVFVHTRGDGGG